MNIINRQNIGQDCHAYGWPMVMRAIGKAANGRSPLLDDCVEYSHVFGPNRRPCAEPWVGIFHFANKVNSPYMDDVLNHSAQSVLRSQTFHDSRPRLKAAIAMTKELGDWLREWLAVPVTVVKHPAETDVPQWSLEKFRANPLMLQLGFDLRDTRAIYYQPPIPNWRYARIAFRHECQRKRDHFLKRTDETECNPRVEDWPRMPLEKYAATLASCVVLSRAYGMGGTNVVTECIASGTPLLVNKVSGALEYLGEDYPLYIEDHPSLDGQTLLRANRAMVAARGDWMSFDLFAAKVKEAVDG